MSDRNRSATAGCSALAVYTARMHKYRPKSTIQSDRPRARLLADLNRPEIGHTLASIQPLRVEFMYYRRQYVQVSNLGSLTPFNRKWLPQTISGYSIPNMLLDCKIVTIENKKLVVYMDDEDSDSKY